VFENEWKQRAVLPSPRRQPSVNHRHITPDVDIDGGTPEPDVTDNTREAQSDEIVKQLERGLPRWEGFGDSGWSANFGEVGNWSLWLLLEANNVCNRIDSWKFYKESKDVKIMRELFILILMSTGVFMPHSGNLVSGVLDAIPESDTKQTLPFHVCDMVFF
jgi:hypothetical protein